MICNPCQHRRHEACIKEKRLTDHALIKDMGPLTIKCLCNELHHALIYKGVSNAES